MRKVVLYIALSADGYIADANGGIGWLEGHAKEYTGDYGYTEFIEGVDTIVMGYNTYHQISTELFQTEWPYKGMVTYVLTHRKRQDTDEIKFVDCPVTELVDILKRQEGKEIWICGGAAVAQPLVERDEIDEYQLSVAPTILGRGVRLFKEADKEIPLQLVSSTPINGIVCNVYTRRNTG